MFVFCFLNSSGTNSLKPKLIPCFDSKIGRGVSSLAHQCSGAILRRYEAMMVSCKSFPFHQDFGGTLYSKLVFDNIESVV